MKIAVVDPTAAAIAAAVPESVRLVGVDNARGPAPVFHLDLGGRPGHPEIRIVIELEPGERLVAGDHHVNEPQPRRRRRARR